MAVPGATSLQRVRGKTRCLEGNANPASAPDSPSRPTSKARLLHGTLSVSQGFLGGSQQQMSTSHTPVPTEQHLKPRYQGTRKFPSWLASKTVFLALRAILRQASPLSCEQRQMWHLHFSVRTAPSDRFVWTVLFIIQTHVLLLYCLGPGKGSVNMVA